MRERDRQIDRGRERDSKRAFTCWLTPQMAAEARLSQTKPAVRSLGLPHTWQWPKYLGNLLWLSQGHEQGAGLEEKQPSLRLAPLLDARVAHSSVLHNTSSSERPAHCINSKQNH